MRWPVVLLLVLVAVLQYPLWLGRGGWLRVWEIDKSLQAQREHNYRLEQRNARIDAEVADLQSGSDAIEERARFGLGLVQPGEIFIQVPQTPRAAAVPQTDEPEEPPPTP